MMPEKARHLSHIPLLAAAGLALAMLSGCSTSKATEPAGQAITETDAAAAAGQQDARDTAVSGYVDPALVSAHSAANSAEPDAAAGIPQTGYPVTNDAMQQGVVTEPTGIRAGSSSIFSGAAPGAPPSAAGTYPAPLATGRIDARSGSMFSAPANRSIPQICGSDAEGLPISC